MQADSSDVEEEGLEAGDPEDPKGEKWFFFFEYSSLIILSNHFVGEKFENCELL